MQCKGRSLYFSKRPIDATGSIFAQLTDANFRSPHFRNWLSRSPDSLDQRYQYSTSTDLICGACFE